MLVAASPTRGLDVGAIETVHAYLREAAAEGVGGAPDQRGPRRDPRARRPDRRHVRGRGSSGELDAPDASVEEIGLLMAGGHDRVRIERRLSPAALAPGRRAGRARSSSRSSRSGDRARGDGPRPARDLPAALRRRRSSARRARPDADRGHAARLHRARRGGRVPHAALQHRRRGPALHRRDHRGCGRALLRRSRRRVGARDRRDGRRRLRGRRGLGADPGLPAGVLQDERDHHLADAQLRRRVPPHVPDLRQRVVLARDDRVQRDASSRPRRRCPTRRSGRRWHDPPRRAGSRCRSARASPCSSRSVSGSCTRARASASRCRCSATRRAPRGTRACARAGRSSP